MVLATLGANRNGMAVHITEDNSENLQAMDFLVPLSGKIDLIELRKT
ncbi:hypothetical protein [Endozoicomonas atrinae]